MEEEDNILGAINEDASVGDGEDVEMFDVEEGELVERDPQVRSEKRTETGLGEVRNGGSQTKKRRHRGNKKRNKGKKSGSGSKPINIDRFVLDTCRRLKEKKSYMVYTAVGCLGVAALSDLVREVDAIQACGGQMTADGKRSRTGGGILWNILKAREPAAFREIMKKTKEFEKQFKQPNIRKVPEEDIRASQHETDSALPDVKLTLIPSDGESIPDNQPEESSAEGKRKSVHARIRVPVSYDDLIGEDLNTD